MIVEPDKLGKISDKHIEYEFEKEDVDATMNTMTDEPYVHHMPTLTGGLGYDHVYHMYKNNFWKNAKGYKNKTSVAYGR